MFLDNELSKVDLRTLGRCLVIGGSGFLGRHLSRCLHYAGVSVTTYSRHPSAELAQLGIAGLAGDIRDAGSVSAACAGMDTVFHTASCCNMWGPRELFFGINCTGTFNVLEACRTQHCARLIYTGTPSVVTSDRDIVDGDESLPYAPHYLAWYPATKRISEEAVLAANCGGLSTCSLRPHLMWGPDDPHMLPVIEQAVLHGRLKQVGEGRNIVSITQVENAVWAHVLAALELCGTKRCAGKPYFICDHQAVALWPWLNGVLKTLGYPSVTGRISVRMAYFLATLSEWRAKALPFTGAPVITRFVVRQLSQSHSFSWGRAHDDFGYSPVISNDAGIAELASH